MNIEQILHSSTDSLTFLFAGETIRLKISGECNHILLSQPPSQMNVAPWCYKWIGDGLDIWGEVQSSLRCYNKGWKTSTWAKYRFGVKIRWKRPPEPPHSLRKWTSCKSRIACQRKRLGEGHDNDRCALEGCNCSCLGETWEYGVLWQENWEIYRYQS